MNTEEHLELILTFCRSRLALAEKRTPGAWERERYRVFPAGQEEPVCSLSVCDADGEFIAACAGAAEAGWRATIAAIGRFRQIADMAKAHPVFESYATWAEQGLENILAAYPLKLLTD